MGRIICKSAVCRWYRPLTIRYRADYVNDEEIMDIIHWRHPHADISDIEFTEEEKLVMVNLPRKEC